MGCCGAGGFVVMTACAMDTFGSIEIPSDLTIGIMAVTGFIIVFLMVWFEGFENGGLG